MGRHAWHDGILRRRIQTVPLLFCAKIPFRLTYRSERQTIRTTIISGSLSERRVVIVGFEPVLKNDLLENIATRRPRRRPSVRRELCVDPCRLMGFLTSVTVGSYDFAWVMISHFCGTDA
jgi:hypothetical protein